MTALRKLDNDFLRADLAGVRSLLAALPASDVMTRLGLEERADELEAEIAQLGADPPATAASAALFFGGKPVIASRGIETEFSGRFLTQFQDLVAKTWAEDTGQLGQRGIVPNKAQSVLHVTNVVRGSFGFLLEEAEQQGQIIDTALKAAVDEAQALMQKLGDPDEAVFEAAAEDVDPRVLGAARDLFDLLRTNSATLRLVVGNADTAFGEEAIGRAVERATVTTVQDEETTLQGVLGGTLPDAHQFEFQAASLGTIRGKVAREIPSAELLEMNRTWTGKSSSARFGVRSVLRNGEVVRQSFTLLGLSADGALAITAG